MHCSATADRQTGRSSLLFGLSGTGKTTLSADPKRHLIGDDEHCWSDDGIFNIEGGCYAKAINLTPESEPDIFQALRFGAVLENVVLEEDRSVDFTDTSITQNTRGAYPIEFIHSAKIPCVAGHPTDVIFLTCDAFGVLPPVSSLSPAHAMYHFISGYTAKVAGTEMGVTEPQATFSPCFGGPFLVWHPTKYAELLAAKMKQHHARVWLVNTGWSGGPYGTGHRISLKHTRAIIDAIHSGALCHRPHRTRSGFRFRCGHRLPERPDRHHDSTTGVGRPVSLRRGGEAPRGAVQREFQDVWRAACGAEIVVSRGTGVTIRQARRSEVCSGSQQAVETDRVLGAAIFSQSRCALAFCPARQLIALFDQRHQRHTEAARRLHRQHGADDNLPDSRLRCEARDGLGPFRATSG